MKDKYIIYLFEEKEFVADDCLTKNVHCAMDFDSKKDAADWMKANRPMEYYTILMVCDDNF